MSTITLPNIRVSSDLEIRLKLKDGGVAIDWSTLTNIKASIYSDRQRSLAGRCDIAIDEDDNTILVCRYSANKPQYPGVNRVIVCCTYDGETKTYDKPAFTFVRWTDDQAGQSITIDDPDIDVEITVEDVSSSILQEAVEAANNAAERANDAAAAAEHMVDIHTGPAGKSPYIGENGHWYEWDETAQEYVDTETEAQGETGTTPDITIGTVTTAEPGTPAAATMTGTPEAPVLNLTIPKGVAGDTPAFTVGEVTTGQPGTPVVVTITGTPEAPVLNVQIPQGLQGNPGSSVDYPFELVNNATTNDATKAATAAVAKGLKDDITQLEAKVDGIPAFDLDLTIPVTQGTGISSSTKHDFGSPLKAGMTYNIKRIGTAAKSITFYTWDENGTAVSCLWNGTTPANSSTFTASVNEKTFKPSADVHKWSVYVSTANAEETGDMIFRLHKDGVEGLEDKVSALETKTAVLDTIDNTPVADSNNLVKSGGIFSAIASAIASIKIPHYSGKNALRFAYSTASFYCPANTIENAISAFHAGFDGVKADIRNTSDNKLICCHDPGFTLDADDPSVILTYDAASPNTIAIDTLTLAQVQGLSYKQNDNILGYQAKVCSVEKILSVCKEYGKLLFLTFRDDYNNQSAVITELKSLLDKYGMEDSVIINNFPYDLSVCEAIRAGIPGAKICVTYTHNQPITTSLVDEVLPLGNVELCIFSTSATDWGNSASAITYAHQNGIPVGIGVMNTTKEVIDASYYGADFTISQKPTELYNMFDIWFQLVVSGGAVSFANFRVGSTAVHYNGEVSSSGGLLIVKNIMRGNRTLANEGYVDGVPANWMYAMAYDVSVVCDTSGITPTISWKANKQRFEVSTGLPNALNTDATYTIHLRI